jgi:glycine/D-amino acid oxidase-like deaminating enzyme
MTALTAKPHPHIVTEHGAVSCDRAVLALNAWGAALPQMRRALVVVASDVVATEPIPERLDQIGWARDLTISDSRRLVQYYRPTDQGRIVFGKGGGTLAPGGRVGTTFSHASGRAGQVRNQFARTYPSLWDVRIANSWRGPIDYSVTGMPFFCPLNGRRDIFIGAGFSGNGIGPSYLAGRTLATMALDGHDDAMPAALTRSPTAALPPEPMRYAGGLLVRAAVARKEDKEDLGSTASAAVRLVASLDPTSFVDRGSAKPNRGVEKTRNGEVTAAGPGH